MSALDFVRPQDVRRLLRQQPEYVVNRDRAGALLHDGFATYDAYVKAKPFIFTGSLIGMAGSAYMWNKRKKHGSEAITAWGVAFLGFAATAWMTRPGGGSTDVSTPAAPGTGFIGYVDKRVAKLSAQDPSFADKAFDRLVSNPSVQPQWAALHPVIQATVV